MEAFLRRAFRPMLLTERKQPLDGEGWLSELKLDGIRCLAYLDADTSDLRNKRNLPLLPTFPELEGLHRQAHGQCVLDGELILTDAQGKPDFEALQARSLTSDHARVQLLSRQAPATFVAFDILALNGDDMTGRPLRERREILGRTVTEGGALACSRALMGDARVLFRLTTEQGLEGIVQKRLDSRYQPGKRSRDWVKVKNHVDEDFLACGYILKSPHTVSLVLGTWREGEMVYQGHVTLGVSRMAAGRFPTSPACPFEKYHRGTRTLSGIARRSTAPLSIWSEPASTACGKRSSRGFGRMGRAGAGELPCRTILFLKSANK